MMMMIMMIMMMMYMYMYHETLFALCFSTFFEWLLIIFDVSENGMYHDVAAKTWKRQFYDWTWWLATKLGVPYV